jgi:hypothetical protein
MSRFPIVQRVAISYIHAGHVGCAVRLIASSLGSCAWWNDHENDCETARWFGNDAGLELVAAGVTLRMTDPSGVLHWTCPPAAAGAGPVEAAGLM